MKIGINKFTTFSEAAKCRDQKQKQFPNSYIRIKKISTSKGYFWYVQVK